MATAVETVLRGKITGEEAVKLRAMARQKILRARAEIPPQQAASRGSHYEDAGGPPGEPAGGPPGGPPEGGYPGQGEPGGEDPNLRDMHRFLGGL